MKCSICDREATLFIFHHWHCPVCVQIIQETIGRDEDDPYLYLDNKESDHETRVGYHGDVVPHHPNSSGD